MNLVILFIGAEGFVYLLANINQWELYSQTPIAPPGDESATAIEDENE